MENLTPRPPVQSGEPAPEFELPAVHREGAVALSDYKGQKPVLISLLRGLYCPFCRRHIASMAGTKTKLSAVGVEALALVTTQPERARTYFKFRPTPLAIGSDPDLAAHRAFGIPQFAMDQETIQAAEAVTVNPTGELAAPENPLQAMATLNQRDSFQFGQVDNDDIQRNAALLAGMFLIDSDGIVRWSFIEGAQDGLAGFGRFPSEDELLAAARQIG